MNTTLQHVENFIARQNSCNRPNCPFLSNDFRRDMHEHVFFESGHFLQYALVDTVTRVVSVVPVVFCDLGKGFYYLAKGGESKKFFKAALVAPFKTVGHLAANTFIVGGIAVAAAAAACALIFIVFSLFGVGFVCMGFGTGRPPVATVLRNNTVATVLRNNN